MTEFVDERVTLLPNGKDFLVEVIYLPAEVAGVKFLVAVSIFSFLAVLGLLVAIGLSAWNTRKSINPYMFVRSHSCAYLVSMLVCDLLQAIGSIMNSAWTKRMAVEFGTTCVAQGVIKHISDVGPAIWSLVIAGHTFWILFLRRDVEKYVFIATLICGWSLIGILVIGGPATVNESKNGSFYGISGHWCWISDGFPVSRIMLDYFWMFFSAGLCFILYGLILLKLRGNIVTHGWKLEFKLKVQKPEDDNPDSGESQMKAIAKQMLLYPIAYTIMILPIACCRFTEWTGHNVSWGATIFSDSIFLLSGVVNVVLFITTRRVLPPHTVITKRLSLPAIATPFVRRFSSSDTLAGTIVPKAINIEEASVDLEKGTHVNHETSVKVEGYTMDYNNTTPPQDVQHLTVPPVSPLRPEAVAMTSAPTTNTHLAPPANPHTLVTSPSSTPVPAPVPTPAHQRQFHDIPLNTPRTVSPHLSHLPHYPGDHDDDDESDYSTSPSSAGYRLSSPDSSQAHDQPSGLTRPNPHTETPEHGHPSAS